MATTLLVPYPPLDTVGQRSLEDLPTEILSLIIQHSYSPWSLSVLDRVIKGTLAIDGLPSTPLFLVSKLCASLALQAERTSFTGELIFTTSCTQWRVLARLRTLSPHRIGTLLDGIHTLRFCSPPLFTNRIPWQALPGLQRVELDYCKRAATFRAQGTLRELEAGYLDLLVVRFARDSERFDGPVVEDAWRVNTAQNQNQQHTPRNQHRTEISVSSEDSEQKEPDVTVVSSPTSDDENTDDISSQNLTDDRNPPEQDQHESKESGGISVIVTKTMNVTESPHYCPGITPIPTPLPFGGSCNRITENWKIRVTATHRGKLESVSYRLLAGFHEVPRDLEEVETVVWTSECGFRPVVPLDKVDEVLVRRKLVPSDLGLRFCF